MKNLKSIKLSLIVFSFLFPVLSYSQIGTIKIFSELKDINIYLDEVLQGAGINTIDSVPIGSHYLKVVKDSVIVFGELITVTEKTVTTILVKDSEEIQNKLKNEKLKKEQELLESKSDAIKKYDQLHLDILVNTRYVTETNTASQSKYYPGYYSSSGKTESSTVSETKAYTDWFITQGGKQISHNTFAHIIGERHIIDTISAQNKIIKRKRGIRLGFGVPIFISGLVSGGFFVGAMISSSPWLLPAIGYVGGFVTGMALIVSTPQYLTLSYSIDEAKEKINIYNQNLKKELELPANYEPK